MPAASAPTRIKTMGTFSTLAILRERTRELHMQLETSVDLGTALDSVQSYSQLLLRYLSVYRPFEYLLKQQDAAVIEVVSQSYESKVALLERDLQALGVDGGASSLAAPPMLPRLNDLDSVLGALYVVEGSALGGQIIYRQLQQCLGLDADTGAAFFYGSGPQTGAVWKRFTVLLERHALRAEMVVDAAAAMFRAFEQGLSTATEKTRRA